MFCFLVDDFQHWITQEVPLAVGLKRFIIRVIRGGRTFEDDQGDIAFDNFEVERRDCHLGTYKQVQRIIINAFFHRTPPSTVNYYATSYCALTSHDPLSVSLISALNRIKGIVFACYFETDLCIDTAMGGWQTGSDTPTDDTGPDRGAKDTRQYIILGHVPVSL